MTNSNTVKINNTWLEVDLNSIETKHCVIQIRGTSIKVWAKKSPDPLSREFKDMRGTMAVKDWQVTHFFGKHVRDFILDARLRIYEELLIEVKAVGNQTLSERLVEVLNDPEYVAKFHNSPLSEDPAIERAFIENLLVKKDFTPQIQALRQMSLDYNYLGQWEQDELAMKLHLRDPNKVLELTFNMLIGECRVKNLKPSMMVDDGRIVVVWALA